MIQNSRGLLVFLSLACFLRTEVHGINFVSVLGTAADNKIEEDEQHGRQLPSKDTYGYFEIGCLCIGLHKGSTKNGTNLRAQLCEEGNPAQLWRFDDNDKGGKLHSKADDKKCVRFRKHFRLGSRLRITDCNSKRKNQKFYHDGDGFGPINNKGEGIGTDFNGSHEGAFLVLSELGISFDKASSYDDSCPGPIVNCPGQREENYCDCGGDCSNSRICGCEKAKKCCEDNADRDEYGDCGDYGDYGDYNDYGY